MRQAFRYVVGILVVVPILFVLSFILSLMWAGAMDSDMDTTSPVHFRLVMVANAIADFPMRYIQNWDAPSPGMSEQTCLAYCFVGMLINSVFWAFVLVFLLRLAAPLFRTKRREVL
jgi:hypothetical protein